MDDVLDYICTFHHSRDIYRHLSLLVSILLRTKNSICSLAAISLHKRLQPPIQEVCTSHAVFKRKGNWWLPSPSKRPKLWCPSTLREARLERGGHSGGDGCFQGTGCLIGETPELQHAGPQHHQGRRCPCSLGPPTTGVWAGQRQTRPAEDVQECFWKCWQLRHRLESFDLASGRKVPHPQPLKPREWDEPTTAPDTQNVSSLP